MVLRGAVLLYQEALKQLEQPHTLLVSPFQLECTGLLILNTPSPET